MDLIECPPYKANVSISFCADSHRKANSQEGIKAGTRTACRFCPIGAKNLGTSEFIERSELFGSRVCARCERQSRRLIRETCCVSCYNRELEARTGLNKRGNPLVKIHVYYQAKVRFQSRDGTEGTATFKVESEAEAIRCARMTIPDLLRITGIEQAMS